MDGGSNGRGDAAGPSGGSDGGTAGQPSERPATCTTAADCSEPDECCDGACVTLDSDAANCGACGVVCTADTAEGQCGDGECLVKTCSEGLADCDGEWSNGCETAATGAPETPQLLRPLTGDYTGSVHAAVRGTLRPAFSWSPVQPGTCGALRYELQVDDSCNVTNFDACEFGSPEIQTEVETLSYVPTDDLPVQLDTAPVGRRYYWRVRACDSGECSAWSEPRYVDVGRVRQDVNGDGYADILLGQRYGTLNQYAIHLGRADLGKVRPSPSRTFESDGTSTWGEGGRIPMAFLGDVNGDGFGDFGTRGKFGLVPCDNTMCPFVDTVLYFGAALLADMKTLRVLPPKPRNTTAGVFFLGDYDGDGMADFSVSHSSTPTSDLAWLYRGAPQLDSTLQPAYEVTAPIGVDGDYFAYNAAAVGDVTGDGQRDLYLSATHSAKGAILRLSAGAKPALAGVITQVAADEASADCWYTTSAPLGDLDRDGFDDFAISCGYTDHQVRVFFGAAPAPSSFATKADTAYEIASGDVDGDGLLDLLTTKAGSATTGPGVYLGSAIAKSNRPALLTAVKGSNVASSYALASADHNGDGFDDIALLATDLYWIAGSTSLATTLPTAIKFDLRPNSLETLSVSVVAR